MHAGALGNQTHAEEFGAIVSYRQFVFLWMFIGGLIGAGVSLLFVFLVLLDPEMRVLFGPDAWLPFAAAPAAACVSGFGWIMMGRSSKGRHPEG